jgi:hypothetical protein
MKYETESAATWLTNQLNDSLLSREQKRRFQQSLQSGMCNKYATHWYDDQPSKGQAFRSIIIDIENKFVDELILEACNRAGIVDFLHKLQVPFTGLTLWVDPGEVEVQFFKHRTPQMIFSKFTGANVDMPLPVPRSQSPSKPSHTRSRSPPARSFSPPARSFSPTYQPTPLFVPPQQEVLMQQHAMPYQPPLEYHMPAHEYHPVEWEQPIAYSQAATYAAPAHVLYPQHPQMMGYQQVGTFA